MTEVKQSLVMV